MFEFVIWDVQHGNAAYLKSPNGRHIVVDLGTGSYGDGNLQFSPLLHMKNVWKLNRLDFVMITHPHRDHLDDIENFYELHPKVLMRPSLKEEDIRKGNKAQDSEKLSKYLVVDRNYTQTVNPEDDPRIPASYGGLKMRFFLTPECSTTNLNNHSYVTIFEYANSKLILPGDNERESWLQLLQNKNFLEASKDADILVAPHHGRVAGFCSELFRHISPRLTLISDGPYCDTSATGNYGNVTQGWPVHYPDGTSETRKCVTTRCDGFIRGKFFTGTDNRTYLNIFVGKGTAARRVGA